MMAFRAHFEDILTDMLWKDRSLKVPGPCSTPGCLESATARCRECRAKEPTCLKCAARNHRNLPFHWIDIWNGEFFERRDLSDTGFVLYLGHHGDPCPHIPTRGHPVAFVIVHDNGVHNSKVHYCHCPGRLSQLRQLVRSDLFPATLERIETAFTCEVLERFHVDFDVCKRSSQDFVRILNLMSGGTQETGEVKVRRIDELIHSNIAILTFQTGPVPRLYDYISNLSLPHHGQAIWPTSSGSYTRAERE